jgi:hypothetical protein
MRQKGGCDERILILSCPRERGVDRCHGNSNSLFADRQHAYAIGTLNEGDTYAFDTSNRNAPCRNDNCNYSRSGLILLFVIEYSVNGPFWRRSALSICMILNSHVAEAEQSR